MKLATVVLTTFLIASASTEENLGGHGRRQTPLNDDLGRTYQKKQNKCREFCSKQIEDDIKNTQEQQEACVSDKDACEELNEQCAGEKAKTNELCQFHMSVKDFFEFSGGNPFKSDYFSKIILSRFREPGLNCDYESYNCGLGAQRQFKCWDWIYGDNSCEEYCRISCHNVDQLGFG